MAFIAVAGVLGVTLLAWRPASAQQSVAYQITPAHDGAANFRPALKLPLQRVWSYQFPETYPRTPPSVSYPIIAEGKVFVTVALPGLEFRTRIAALSLKTGKPTWTRDYISNHFWAASAYDAGRLFVITAEGLLYALDPQTGTPIWQTTIADGSVSLFDSPPTARDGMIYLAGMTGGNGTLFAVDQVTGNVVWKNEVWFGSVSSPTLSNDGVFVSYPCQVYKFDPQTGALQWRYNGPCYGGGGATAVYYSGKLFARYAYAATDMFVFDASSGHRIKKMVNIIAPPAFQGGIGYFAIDQSKRLSAWSVATGKLLWQFTGAGQPAFPPIVVNGKVLVTSEAGDLFVLDGTSGNVLQRIALGKPTPLTLEGPYLIQQGLGAGQGMIIVPAGDTLIAFKGASN